MSQEVKQKEAFSFLRGQIQETPKAGLILGPGLGCWQMKLKRELSFLTARFQDFLSQLLKDTPVNWFLAD